MKNQKTGQIQKGGRFLCSITKNGFYLSYLTIKTKSVIPAGIAHSAINGFAAFSIILCRGTVNPFIGPAPTGIIGGCILILVGIYCYIKLGKIENPFEEEVIINN